MSGRLIVMGSGEIAPSLVATHRAGIEAAGADDVTVLDTPFGFQENAEQLTARLVDFFATSLRIEATVASLREPHAPVVQQEQMLAAVRRARYVFAGPGSPSYALRVWRRLALVDALHRVVAAGGTVTFASAAALTLGPKTIPVYEIYKVGADPHWLEGLDLTGRLGLRAVVIPHWNNAEGGNHDTSRCYIGRRRLAQMRRELDAGIVGVDEHTAAVFDFAAGTLSARGVGGVVVVGREEVRLEANEHLAMDQVRRVLDARPHSAVPETTTARHEETNLASALARGDADAAAAAVLAAEDRAADERTMRPALRSMIVELAEAARAGLADPQEAIAPFVDALLDVREQARQQRDFATADAIRDSLAAEGVEVRDTHERVEWQLR